MKRPLIGVSGPDRGGLAAWYALRVAIRRAGGVPRRITPGRPCDPALLDGLVLAGGADLDPELYGVPRQRLRELLREAEDEARRGQTSRWTILVAPALYLARRLLSTRHPAGIDTARDTLEMGLLEGALRRRLPVLGICRGAQLLNVFFGGTLLPDLAELYGEVPGGRTVLPRKEVRLEPGSRLAAVLGRDSCRVNALHHQAVDAPGHGIAIVAREPTGIVQGIEHEHLPLAIGVQWHPEYLPQHPSQRRLFSALVQAAASR